MFLLSAEKQTLINFEFFNSICPKRPPSTCSSVTQLNSLVGEANRLLNSPGWENLLPQLENTIGRVGEESDKVIDHTFVRGVFLLLIWLVGYLLARFALYYFTTKRSSGS